MIILFMLAIISCDFAPGSYPYAEVYEFDVSEKSLIETVKSFKRDNPKYVLKNQDRFVDGFKNNSRWYHIWFYYPERNIIVKCWIRDNKIGFVGIGDGMELKNYKEINKDIAIHSNIKEKQIFEKLIICKIKKYLKSSKS